MREHGPPSGRALENKRLWSGQASNLRVSYAFAELSRTPTPELPRIRVPRNQVNKRSLTPLLAVLFGSSPYLISINIAWEAGYERTVRVTQDDDGRFPDQI